MKQLYLHISTAVDFDDQQFDILIESAREQLYHTYMYPIRNDATVDAICNMLEIAPFASIHIRDV